MFGFLSGFGGVFSFLKVLPWKWIIALLILGLLTYGYQWHVGQIHMAGYNQAKAEYLDDLQEKLAIQEELNQQKVNEVQADLANAKAEAKTSSEKAIELQQLLNKRPTAETPREIEKLNTDCSDLGADYRLRYNRIIGDAPVISNE